MANELLKKIAAKINAQIDVPLVPEGVEQAGIEMALEVGLGFLPPRYIAMVQSASDGVDDTEAEDVRNWLCDLMKEYSGIPDVLCGFAATTIVGLLRHGVEVVLE